MMTWQVEQRCPYCGAQIGRREKVKFNLSIISNLKKKCQKCGTYGCLCCMEGSLKSGIFYHKDCQMAFLKAI